MATPKMSTAHSSVTASPSSSLSLPTPASPQSSSPLFKLPRELRDRIYVYALTASTFIVWPPPPVYALPASLSTSSSQVPRRNIALPLIMTSRAVYQEAAPLLYACNHFNFQHPSDLNMWVNISDRHARTHLSHLYLRIRDRDFRSLWSGYLGSSSPVRSLMHDLPNLKSLHVWFRMVHWAAEAAEGFRRWNHDPALESLCLVLKEKTPRSADVRVVCVHRVARRDVDELLESYEAQLLRMPGGDLRTGWRSLHDVKVCLELTPMDMSSGGHSTGAVNI